jgi:hypothetical protein
VLVYLSINVYWSYFGESWIRATAPENFIKSFYEKYIPISSNDEIKRMASCPGVKNYFKNIYSVKSMYDYALNIDDDLVVTSEMHDQDFFNKHVLVRDAKIGLLSFSQNYIFFTDAPSLEMSWQIPTFLEKDKNYYTVPGRYDIGKWFRVVDFSFLMKDGESSFSIKNGEPFTYVEFHTNEKINFIKFEPKDSLRFYSNACFKSNYGRISKPRDLLYFYQSFNLKSRVLKEIKKSIVE